MNNQALFISFVGLLGLMCIGYFLYKTVPNETDVYGASVVLASWILIGFIVIRELIKAFKKPK